MKYISLLFLLLFKVRRRLLMWIYRPLFCRYGKNFVFDPFGLYSYDTIEVGNDVFIGPRANFGAIKKIKIGNKVMFGPDVSILGGDHNTTQIGEFMTDVQWKLPENDLDVIIEDDVWIGARATIMKGVTIGTGSIVAAGAIVTKDVEPYSIVGGIPAKFLKYRFPEKELKKHMEILNNRKTQNTKK